MIYALVAALALSAHAVQVEGPAAPAPAPAVAALGTPQNPLRVAVVGAGPAGFYTADALLKQKDLAVQVDVFEALPAPYGLVRSGLAPDHQKLKNASKVYDRIAENPAVRYFGNVTVGRDVTEADLSRLFDQVVYASGAPQPRALAVPGAEAQGVHPAFDFVGFYNSHPDHQAHRFDLSGENAVVVGAGNTAVDVVRLLSQDPDKLAETDIAPSALAALRDSKIKTVTLLARRGPGQAAFSAAELKALAELESADVVVRSRDIEQARGEAGLSANAQKTFDMLAELAERGAGERARKIRLMFFSSPAELEGRDGRLSGVRVERTRLAPDGKGGLAAQGTGEFETIPADVLFHAIGWRGPGLVSREGRVIDPATGEPLAGRYVAGWAKSGGAGLLGDQMRDAAATVKSMVADLPTLTPAAERGRETVDALLKLRGVNPVSFPEWKKIDAAEVAAGAPLGKARLKFSTRAAMLAASGRQPVPKPASRFAPRPEGYPVGMTWRTAPLQDFDSMVMSVTEGWSLVLTEVYFPVARRLGMDEGAIRQVMLKLDGLGLYGWDLRAAFEACGGDVDLFLKSVDDGSLPARLAARKVN